LSPLEWRVWGIGAAGSARSSHSKKNLLGKIKFLIPPHLANVVIGDGAVGGRKLNSRVCGAVGADDVGGDDAILIICIQIAGLVQRPLDAAAGNNGQRRPPGVAPVERPLHFLVRPRRPKVHAHGVRVVVAEFVWF
jgi:hypothetical protein